MSETCAAHVAGCIRTVRSGPAAAAHPVCKVMAKIINIPISGKVGLQVDMPGRYGQVRRAWVIPSNPNTTAQMAVRARLTTAIAGYEALTQAQQNAWINAAKNMSTRSRLGMSGAMTGLQLYTKLNTTLAMLGEDPIDTPPGTVIFGAIAPQNLVPAYNGGNPTLKLTCPTSPGENTVLRASAPVTTATRRTPPMVVIGTCPAPQTGSADITALYTAKFGAPVVGKKVFVSAQLHVTGYLGPQSVFTAVVPGA